MGMFDQSARYACRMQPLVVARRLLRNVRERLEFWEFHDTRTTPLPGQRDRTVDSVMILDNLDSPASVCLIILEFQAQADEDKLESTLVSVAHMRADLRHGEDHTVRYEVFAGMVYLCGQPGKTSLAMTLTDKAGQRLAGTDHRVLLWKIEEDDAIEVATEIDANFEESWGLLYWYPLMANAGLPEQIAAWMALWQRVPSIRHRADMVKIAIVFAELAGRLDEWRKALKEYEMKESKVILEWTKEAREEGEAKGMRTVLLRFARSRFKGELTEEDEQMISSQESASVLEDWSNGLADAKNYAEFRAVLRR